VFCRQRLRHRPSIFTDHEIQLLVAHAARLGPPGSLRPTPIAPCLPCEPSPASGFRRRWRCASRI
jgi:hypothetical protein